MPDYVSIAERLMNSLAAASKLLPDGFSLVTSFVRQTDTPHEMAIIEPTPRGEGPRLAGEYRVRFMALDVEAGEWSRPICDVIMTTNDAGKWVGIQVERLVA